MLSLYKIPLIKSKKFYYVYDYAYHYLHRHLLSNLQLMVLDPSQIIQQPYLSILMIHHRFTKKEIIIEKIPQAASLKQHYYLKLIFLYILCNLQFFYGWILTLQFYKSIRDQTLSVHDIYKSTLPKITDLVLNNIFQQI